MSSSHAIVIAAVAVAIAAASAEADPLPIPERHREPGAGIAPGPRRPPPPAQPAKPAKDVALAGDALAGTYTCTGAVTKVDIAVALDKAWISWRVTGGAGTTLSFRTFDAVAKQWTMIELTSATTHREAASLGADAKGTWTWQIDATHRELEQLDGKTLHLWGERRSGTSWAKNYDASCTR